MRVRVHVYERSFPEEPNNAFSVGATAVDTAFDTWGSALDDGTKSAVLPHDKDTYLGA